MRKVLLAWIGKTDLRAPLETDAVGLGPIAQALTGRAFDEAHLLSDYDPKSVQPYVKWLKGLSSARIHVVPEKLSGPTNFGEIYEAAVRGVEGARKDSREDTALSFHLSPGTPAMAAVWILLGKTRYPAELIESSREHGVRTASVPFDISAEFLPDLLRESDERLRDASEGKAPLAPEFSQIVHRSDVMRRLIQRARRVAVRSLPVLLEGESGTGKELFARAIHNASPRREGPFVAVNCGAIPATLLESELFGHERGAFSGANQRRKGHFESAHGGTLFLDELGELPLDAQVKLLRVLQEDAVTRVGSSTPVEVDVRILAATNRSLLEEVAAGRFREDLFYRLAVAVLRIPPVRERPGDVGLLIESLLAKVNAESASEPSYTHKKLSPSARNLLLAHAWPGNVRELLSTLRRAAVWSDGSTISADEVRDALLSAPSKSVGVLDLPLGNGFDLDETLANVARHYLERAMRESGGNKTDAAKLVGLPSYQTLSNWLRRYDAKP